MPSQQLLTIRNTLAQLFYDSAANAKIAPIFASREFKTARKIEKAKDMSAIFHALRDTFFTLEDAICIILEVLGLEKEEIGKTPITGWCT